MESSQRHARRYKKNRKAYDDKVREQCKKFKNKGAEAYAPRKCQLQDTSSRMCENFIHRDLRISSSLSYFQCLF